MACPRRTAFSWPLFITNTQLRCIFSFLPHRWSCSLHEIINPYFFNQEERTRQTSRSWFCPCEFKRLSGRAKVSACTGNGIMSPPPPTPPHPIWAQLAALECARYHANPAPRETRHANASQIKHTRNLHLNPRYCHDPTHPGKPGTGIIRPELLEGKKKTKQEKKRKEKKDSYFQQHSTCVC